MATSINTIKNWFKTGMFPTQAQFWAWIDAFRHKDDKVPVADIEGLDELLEPVNEHFNDPNAHSELFANFDEINTILEDKGFVKTSESFTPNSGTRWNLKGQLFTNAVSIETPIELCSTGFVRTDRVVLDMNNQFVYVIGDEFTENPVPKALPANTLDYTLIPVNDTEVGEPESPSLGNLYISKESDKSQIYLGTGGSNVIIPLNYKGRGTIVLQGDITSLSGLSFDLIDANPSTVVPHEGKEYTFINETPNPIPFNHIDLDDVVDEDLHFMFDDEQNLIVPVGGKVRFKKKSSVLDVFFKSWESGLLGEIQLPAYTSIRNDGANPNNKVLNVDINGNLKLYSMPVMPPPYLEELIPDSYMPSTTGNFIVKGSFFTPTTTVTVQGQTFNYKTFLNDNEILVNLTTNAIEGTYDVTIDNGISVVFPDALLIVSGDVYKPQLADWENITGSIDLAEGDSARVSVQDAGGSATSKSSFFELPATGDFIVQFNFKGSPFEVNPFDSYGYGDRFSLVDSTTLAEKYGICPIQLHSLPGKVYIGAMENGAESGGYVLQSFSESLDGLSLANYTFSIKRIGTSINFYRNNVFQHTASANYAFPMKLKVNIKELDQENIKIIIPF